jgi:DNA adenine methylase
MSYSKPFLKWAGGKHRIVEELTNIIQERPLSVDWDVVSGFRYHEPFLGSGSMFFGLRSNGLIQTKKKSYLNDINGILINCMKVVSDKSKLERLLDMLEKLQKNYSQHERNPRGQTKEVREARMYYVKRKKLNSLSKDISCLTTDQEIELAALTIFLNKTCYNGLWRMNKNGEFNVPEGDYDSPTNICQELILRACQQHLISATLSSSSWEDAFRHVQSGDLVYLDPPYMPLEINGTTFNTYFTDGFSRYSHSHLNSSLKW